MSNILLHLTDGKPTGWTCAASLDQLRATAMGFGIDLPDEPQAIQEIRPGIFLLADTRQVPPSRLADAVGLLRERQRNDAILDAADEAGEENGAEYLRALAESVQIDLRTAAFLRGRGDGDVSGSFRHLLRNLRRKSDRMNSKHAELLNQLDDMASSLAHAVRRDTLREAESLIVAQEKRIAELESALVPSPPGEIPKEVREAGGRYKRWRAGEAYKDIYGPTEHLSYDPCQRDLCRLADFALSLLPQPPKETK